MSASPYIGAGDCPRCYNRGVVFTEDCGVCGGSGSAFGGSCGACSGGQVRSDAHTCPRCHGKSVRAVCPGCGCTPPLNGYLPDTKKIGCGVHGTRGCPYVWDRSAGAWERPKSTA